MSKYFTGILIIIISGILLSFCSCVPQSCFEETEAFVKISFFKKSLNKLQPPDSITMYGLNMETSKIYKKALNVQPVLVPLNSSTDSCVIIIKINNEINDTIKFRYSSYPHLISKECGYSFYHNLDTVRSFTKHAIIDMYYANKNITTVNEENVRIFY
jgi:hypothetical protein